MWQPCPVMPDLFFSTRCICRAPVWRHRHRTRLAVAGRGHRHRADRWSLGTFVQALGPQGLGMKLAGLYDLAEFWHVQRAASTTGAQCCAHAARGESAGLLRLRCGVDPRARHRHRGRTRARSRTRTSRTSVVATLTRSCAASWAPAQTARSAMARGCSMRWHWNKCLVRLNSCSRMHGPAPHPLEGTFAPCARQRTSRNRPRLRPPTPAPPMVHGHCFHTDLAGAE